MFPHHLFYGHLKQSDLYNWRSKLDQIGALINGHALPFAFSKFKKSFLHFLTAKHRFSYTPLIMVEGVKGRKR
jgi:hypothetical protein